MGAKESLPVINELVQEAVESLHLTSKDIKQVWRFFRKFDKDSSGEIEINEFLSLSGDSTISEVFLRNIFKLIDVDASEKIDFGEFLKLIRNFCLLGHEDMLKLCFNMFDADKSGTIDQDELNCLVEVMHHGDSTSNIKSALEIFKSTDANADGKIDFEEFKNLDLSFPLLFYPAFQFQQKLIQESFGEAWWNKKIKQLTNEKSADEIREKRLYEKKVARLRYRQRRKLQMKMTVFRYYCCFWERSKYSKDLETTQPVKIAESARLPSTLLFKGVDEEKRNDAKEELLFKETTKESHDQKKLILELERRRQQRQEKLKHLPFA